MTLRLKGSTSGHTEVKAPASAGSNTITLPTSNGSAEQFLKNSGTAGELEFSSMVETSTGVGIGTASPTRDLEVSKAGSAFIRAINTTNSVNIDVLAGTSAAFVGPQSNHPLAFQTNNTERLRIDSSGNLTAYSGSTDGNYFVIRGKHSPGNDYNRSEVRFGVENNANGLGFLAFATGNNTASERMRIDSSGNVGIGTSSPTAFGPTLQVAGTDPALLLQDTATAVDYFGTNITSGLVTNWYDDAAAWRIGTATGLAGSGYSERLRIDSSGNVMIGTTSAASYSQLTVRATSPQLSLYATPGQVSCLNMGDTDDNDIGQVCYSNSDNSMRFVTNAGERMRIDSGGNSIQYSGATLERQHRQQSSSSYIATNIRSIISGASAYLAFDTNSNWTNGNAAERMRLDSSGSFMVGKTASGGDNNGSELRGGSSNYAGLFTAHNHTPLFVNRKTNDGDLIIFRQDNNNEGSISVSGSTVSYNGAHLSRWSQLAGGSARTDILRGSVLSNLDEMCEWGTEDNEQLNRMKVSDVEGDKNVSGVFQSWDDDDDTYVNDFYCAMTGDFVIRIAQGTTVARGDLLMSAGDGTAKPQDDDIVRSKTIAKVTSTTVSTTYSDNSYCVPCVLMAC